MKRTGVIVLMALLCSCHEGKRNDEHTASDMERADSVLRHVRSDILSEEPDVQEMASGILDMKERLDNIRQYAEDADVLLEEMDYQGKDVADVKSLVESIIEECARNNN